MVFSHRDFFDPLPFDLTSDHCKSDTSAYSSWGGNKVGTDVG